MQRVSAVLPPGPYPVGSGRTAIGCTMLRRLVRWLSANKAGNTGRAWPAVRLPLPAAVASASAIRAFAEESFCQPANCLFPSQLSGSPFPLRHFLLHTCRYVY